MTQRLVGNLDHVALRNGFLVGWGWIMSRGGKPVEITLSLVDGAGRKQPVTFAGGGSREDLAVTFPELPWARSSGFHLTGRVRADATLPLAVKARVIDDTGHTGEMTFPVQVLPGSPVATSSMRYRRLRHAASLLASGQLSLLAVRTARFVRRRLSAAASRLGGMVLRTPASRPGVLIVDHAMGGGANKARRELVQKLLNEGSTVHVLTMELNSLLIQVETRSPGRPAVTRTFESMEAALGVIEPAPLRVVVNSLVSYPDTEGSIHALVRYVEDSGAAVTIPLHDYHAVCPSYTLLDTRGTFCGIPGEWRCAACYPELEIPFVHFSAATSIRQWRAHWSTLIDRADELIAFSESTKSLFSRAFPEAAKRIVIRPHAVQPLRRVLPSADRCELVVAVIGHITHQKGAGVLAEMARMCDDARLPLRFVVFGNLEVPCDAQSLKVLGAYASEDLPALLERHGVHVCAFLSIWPETFSYVCGEIMSMEMPLFAFDLGAPAERIRQYRNGVLVKERTPHALLQALLHYYTTRVAVVDAEAKVSG